MKKVILIFACLLIIIKLVAQPQIIAHRGASYLAPENTVASANRAWELGADAVEIDVHLSKDGRVMVNHDKNTAKTSGENYTIKDTDSATLRKLDVGSWKSSEFRGEKMPFVEEIIETIPEGKTLVIEIKCGSEVLPALKKVIDESGKINQITFISFGWETILDTKKVFSNNPCYWLSGTGIGLEERMKQAAENGIEGVNLEFKVIDKKVMDQAKGFGLQVLSWTIDDPVEADRLIGLGIAGITTNRPAWLRKSLER